MRIAIISPMASNKPPAHFSAWENLTSLLTEGLVAKGVDVTLFTTTGSEAKAKFQEIAKKGRGEGHTSRPKVVEVPHVSGVFERADEFDLIHNLSGVLPLTYSGLVTTPVVTTINDLPTPQTLPIFKKYNGETFFVSAAGANRSPELEYIGAIQHGAGQEGFSSQQMVDKYMEVYEKILERQKREDHRPWGFYTILSDQPDHKVKRITVYPGKRLSLQRHRRRSEHWHIIEGAGVVTLDKEDMEVKTGKSVDIKTGAIHRMKNTGEGNLVFIEVQMGDYFGEDDIERLEDDFGRTRG